MSLALPNNTGGTPVPHSFQNSEWPRVISQTPTMLSFLGARQVPASYQGFVRRGALKAALALRAETMRLLFPRKFCPVRLRPCRNSFPNRSGGVGPGRCFFVVFFPLRNSLFRNWATGRCPIRSIHGNRAASDLRRRRGITGGTPMPHSLGVYPTRPASSPRDISL